MDLSEANVVQLLLVSQTTGALGRKSETKTGPGLGSQTTSFVSAHNKSRGQSPKPAVSKSKRLMEAFREWV